MSVIIVDPQHRRKIDQLYSDWRRELLPKGAASYQMPTIGPPSFEDRISYPDVPRDFLKILSRAGIPFEESSN
jgi:hypothetical protein